jgi:hypothetical protein
MASALNITFPGNLAQVDTAAELRRVPSSFVTDGALYLVTALEGIYEFDTSSNAADTGGEVIRPFDRTALQAGRWIKNADGLGRGPAGATGSSNNTRATRAELMAAATTDGTSLYDNKLWTWTLGDFSLRASDPNVVKSDSVPLTTGAWVTTDGPLYASNYGIRGDGTAETSAVQSFLSLCATLQRAAYFGRLAVTIDGPLMAASVPVIFESAGNGVAARPPGFYARGEGYTALTMSGVITGSQVFIQPDQPGTVTYASDGTLMSDTRPKINGLALGVKDGSSYLPCVLSFVPAIRVAGFNGFGVRKTIVWDCTFGTLTVEDCGESGSSGVWYAYHIVADAADNCNELSIARLQVERAVHRAIYVDPRTLSCTFSKTHTEGAHGLAGVRTWVLGGSTVWLSARLQSAFPATATALLSGPVHVVALRAEMGRVSCDASGARMRIESSGGTFEAADSQNGFITFASCGGSFYNMGFGCTLTQSNADVVELGFCPPNFYAMIDGGTVTDLHRRAGETQAAVRLSGVVASGSLSDIRDTLLLNGTRFTPTTGTQGLGAQNVSWDASSRIAGNVTIDNTAGWWDGVVEGNVNVTSTHRILAGSSARATGAVTGWGPPSATGAITGQYCKNVRPVAVGPAGSQYVVTGWTVLDGGTGFTELRATTGG